MKFANKVDEQYHALLQDILDNGDTVVDERTGVGTKAVFARTLVFDMKDGLPCITTKKMYFKGIIGELLWFLGNHTKDPKYENLPIDNIRYLVDNNINIWVGDCYKGYLNYLQSEECELEQDHLIYCIDDPKENKLRPLTKEEFIFAVKNNLAFADKFGGIGAGYGWQWNHFGGDYKTYRFIGQKQNNSSSLSFHNKNILLTHKGINQIQELIYKLKTNPHDRRLIVSAWNPQDLDKTVLPPCHYGFSCYVRQTTFEERIKWVMQNKDVELENLAITEATYDDDVPKYALSLKWNQRSVDTFLGLPFNITSYAILLSLIAQEVNMIPDKLIGSLENTHIYLNHLEAVQEQLSRDSIYTLPRLNLSSKSIFDMSIDDIKVIGYKSHESIKAKLNN